ncbi:MAG TPA: transposase [Thermoanaerobaculia bacterium]|nr:transposase [Thermoanaerobaculia bacterium]
MTRWPHAPVHELHEPGAYMVTGSTYQKIHHFRSPARLEFLQKSLLTLAEEYGWQMQAWAVFSNHYHFVAMSPGDASSLQTMIKTLHSKTAREINLLDAAKGRQVWFDYWDTHLTFQKSYLARLKYVHTNAVHHELVREASLYPWCSANWFGERASAAFFETVMSFKTDQLTVRDEFDPEQAVSPG